jgi:hypothetical protein
MENSSRSVDSQTPGFSLNHHHRGDETIMSLSAVPAARLFPGQTLPYSFNARKTETRTTSLLFGATGELVRSKPSALTLMKKWIVYRLFDLKSQAQLVQEYKKLSQDKKNERLINLLHEPKAALLTPDEERKNVEKRLNAYEEALPKRLFPSYPRSLRSIILPDPMGNDGNLPDLPNVLVTFWEGLSSTAKKAKRTEKEIEKQVKAYLKAGADIQGDAYPIELPLDAAVRSGRLNLVHLFLDKGAAITDQTLRRAIEGSNSKADILQALLAKNPTIEDFESLIESSKIWDSVREDTARMASSGHPTTYKALTPILQNYANTRQSR